MHPPSYELGGPFASRLLLRRANDVHAASRGHSVAENGSCSLYRRMDILGAVTGGLEKDLALHAFRKNLLHFHADLFVDLQEALEACGSRTHDLDVFAIGIEGFFVDGVPKLSW
jgi:hypothetical protein